jgi:pyrimidine-nucleoside phosphorylase
MEIGLIGVLLGAGRKTVEESVNFSSGVEFCARPGMQVKEGDHLATIYTERAAVLESTVQRVQSAFTISYNDKEPMLPVLVTHFITKDSVEEFDQNVFGGLNR